MVSSIVAAVSPIVAWVIFRRSRRYSELSYERLGSISLLDVETISVLGETIRDRVEVRIDGEQVESLQTTLIILRSTGTLSVEYHSEDANAQTPVTLECGEGAHIVGVETTGVSAVVEIDPEDPSKIVLRRFLLNPGESILVSAFLVDFRGEVQVRGHLKDTHIRERNRERDDSLVRTTILVASSLALLVVSFAYVGYVGNALLISIFGESPIYAPVVTAVVAVIVTTVAITLVGRNQ